MHEEIFGEVCGVGGCIYPLCLELDLSERHPISGVGCSETLCYVKYSRVDPKSLMADISGRPIYKSASAKNFAIFEATRRLPLFFKKPERENGNKAKSRLSSADDDRLDTKEKFEAYYSAMYPEFFPAESTAAGDGNIPAA